MKIILTFEVELDGNKLRKEVKENYDDYTEYFEDIVYDNLFEEETDWELGIKRIKLISATKE